MSKADAKAVIDRYFDAFNAHDVDAMLACMRDDVIHDINQKGREIGKEKFRWYAANAARHVDETLSDIVILSDDTGRRAAAEFTARGIYKSTIDGLPAANGQRFSLSAGSFIEIEDGLISRITTYYNRADLVAQLSAN